MMSAAQVVYWQDTRPFPSLDHRPLTIILLPMVFPSNYVSSRSIDIINYRGQLLHQRQLEGKCEKNDSVKEKSLVVT